MILATQTEFEFFFELPLDQEQTGLYISIMNKTPRASSARKRIVETAERLFYAEGIRAVGIDHFSIGGMYETENTRTHEILLSNEVWVIEELRFPGGWLEFSENAWFQALPLHLPGFSGSPCRAVLFQCA